MKNGGKNKSVALIILVSVHTCIQLKSKVYIHLAESGDI